MFRFHKMLPNFANCSIDCGIRAMVSNILSQALGRDYGNHTNRQRFHRPRFGIPPPWQSLFPFGIGHERLEYFDALPCTALIISCLRIGGISDSRKGLAEKVTARAQRPSGAVNQKKHLSIIGESMPVKKVDPKTSSIQPVLSRLNQIVKRGEHPRHAALYPDDFVRIYDFAHAAKA